MKVSWFQKPTSHSFRYPFDGPGNTLAHAYYPYQFDSYGGDIHFDNDEDWFAVDSTYRSNGRQSIIETGINFFSVAVSKINDFKHLMLGDLFSNHTEFFMH